MPRISREEKARNRQNIVDAAGRLFRAKGIDAVGIADLMKEAGLTHGGFYNHFASKEELAVEVCGASFERSLGVLDAAVERGEDSAGTPLRRVVDDYLSTAHRDAPDGGCPSASLVIDAGRHGDTVQGAYALGVEGYLTGFAAELAREHGEHPAHPEQDGELTPQEARERAVLLLSQLVGAMTLARAVRHTRPELSEEILRTCRAHALD
ncbi:MULTISPECIES: TetR/AcrR family transcriptional regulator [Streptomyces]|jgi:TetR/AcrR family transcriptional repressor of nem operon|uniref:TetR/AcrR family transcriptional regulator n=1 Tax=Streptomyces TaxID=1883 RepID=UPI00177D97E3|nr:MULTISPECIES: TetR/AcrR family transcriptional regulator [Streptomyces]GHE38868.1 TetR family transcriptional regulator [Streptomyces griseoaurantiacus]MCF0085089.1 putative HTH-type transcriptional regulator YfiR [Streptomyces sp. MH192]MCF0097518.1 putative HTH-type transcriptional regulator YfiR [Streptomyces sp. MH191]MDX3089513.1 TetR/AcrR family transcriptional regulator [Streptomyces sp. ME12-02E]MDX3333001.1 TetR/AcrR family transcriptional regulator [Streptomyces sp. ME02-6978a]